VRNITLRPQYIRSHLNVLADRLSRLRDHDEWKLNPKISQEAAYQVGDPGGGPFRHCEQRAV
jgi:hypothetical protein